LAFIRTWTYISFKKEWINDAVTWQGEARLIEDRLSDALHQKLTQRFVDRRTSVLLKRLKQRETLMAEVNGNSEIFVENQLIGKLIGFSFRIDKGTSIEETKTLQSAALAVLGVQYNLQAERLYNASDLDFSLTDNGELFWKEFVVGKLTSGSDILIPGIDPCVDDQAGSEVILKVKRRLTHFVERLIDKNFEPLIRMKMDEKITGLARGIAFRLVEGLGVVPRSDILMDVKALDQESRALLRRHGIRFGQYNIFHHLMLKPAPTRLRIILWSVFSKFDKFLQMPPPGLVTIPLLENAPDDYYPKAGYKLVGIRALRIDMLERLSDLIRVEDVRKGFEASVEMLSITGLTLEQFSDLLKELGFEAKVDVVEYLTP
jgi:ATP-dependent RNA helicase SUPV3L1/SUV3